LEEILSLLVDFSVNGNTGAVGLKAWAMAGRIVE